MPTPPKPITMITGHLTKEQKKARIKAESALVTGESLAEWPSTKSNKSAHKHFLRISKLFQKIEKNDALIESILNRYCVLLSECEQFEKDDVKYAKLITDLEDHREEMEYPNFIRSLVELEKIKNATQTRLQTKRRMLLDIEKENVMTLASQLRSIPKKKKDDPDNKSEMAKILEKKGIKIGD